MNKVSYYHKDGVLYKSYLVRRNGVFTKVEKAVEGNFDEYFKRCIKKDMPEMFYDERPITNYDFDDRLFLDHVDSESYEFDICNPDDDGRVSLYDTDTSNYVEYLDD